MDIVNVLVLKSLSLLIIVSFPYISRIKISKIGTAESKSMSNFQTFIQIDTLSSKKCIPIYKTFQHCFRKTISISFSLLWNFFYFAFFDVLIWEKFISFICIYLSMRLKISKSLPMVLQDNLQDN